MPLTTALIRLIEKHEFLYDHIYNPQKVDYSTKQKRLNVQQQIADTLTKEFPDMKVMFTAKMIMEKWSSLRGQYKTEEKKVSR